MAKENFLTYQRVDPNSRFTFAADRMTFTNLQINESAYAYTDKGAGYYSGDFAFYLTVNITASDASMSTCSALWVLANAVGDWNDLIAGTILNLVVGSSGSGPTRALNLQEYIAGSATSSGLYTITVNTPYYLIIYRDEATGANGTLYCAIYSDAARTSLLTTLSVTLNANNDFRYLYAIASRSNASALKHSGYVEDLEELVDNLLPSVTTRSTTSIASTTATGNGTITALGLAAVTQCGHCWAITSNPTTADSKTTNGAGSIGDFTSAITDLTPGTKYYTRAYATNSFGTSYGANFTFIAGSTISNMEPRNIAVKTSTIRYIGEDGIEYYVQGTAV